MAILSVEGSALERDLVLHLHRQRSNPNFRCKWGIRGEFWVKTITCNRNHFWLPV